MVVMNSFEQTIHQARRGYLTTPILVEIFREGFMFYVVEVSKGPTKLVHGYNHDLNNIHQARRMAHEMVEKLQTPSSNYRVKWKEVIE